MNNLGFRVSVTCYSSVHSGDSVTCWLVRVVPRLAHWRTQSPLSQSVGADRCSNKSPDVCGHHQANVMWN